MEEKRKKKKKAKRQFKMMIKTREVKKHRVIKLSLAWSQHWLPTRRSRRREWTRGAGS